MSLHLNKEMFTITEDCLDEGETRQYLELKDAETF